MRFDLPSSVRDYLAEAIYELSQSNVRVMFHPEVSLHGCVGWYDNDGLEMHVCMGDSSDIWISTFVHEFQHFRQHKSNASCWSMSLDLDWIGSPNLGESDCNSIFETIYMAKSRKKEIRALTAAQKLEISRRVLEVERDCELRTADEIERCRLPVNLNNFKRDAFRNVASYAIAYYVGEWCVINKKRADKLPTDLRIDFFDWASDPKNQKLWVRDVSARKNRLQLPNNGNSL